MRYLSHFTIFFILLVYLGCGSSNSTKKNNRNPKPKLDKKYAIDFYRGNSIYPILDKAKKQKKLVFVDLYTSWCLPCKLMDEDVFSDKEIAKFFNKHFINYKVDLEKGNGPDLKIIFEANSLPTLLFLDEKGRLLKRKYGASYQTELKNLALEAIALDRQNKANQNQ